MKTLLVVSNPNRADYWNESGDIGHRHTYMQVAISSLPDAEAIVSAMLYINIESISGNG